MDEHFQDRPTADRSLNSLAHIFRVPFEAWLAAAANEALHVRFIVTETRRTLETQKWLYRQGREAPYLSAPELTWTLDSRHRWGLAADIAMQRNSTKELIWEISSWQWLYRRVPPEDFGLRSIAPMEWCHLEYRYADEAIKESKLLGLEQL